MDSSPSYEELTNALQQGLDFTPQELEMNQRGRLSEQQKTRLLEYLKGYGEIGQGCRTLLILILLASLAALVGMFFILAGDQARAILSSPIVILVASPVLLIVLLIAFFSGGTERRWRQYIRRIRESPDNAEVLNENGRVRRQITPSRLGNMLYIVVNRKWLRVLNSQEFEAFRDGIAYQIYYVQLGPLPFLLSASVVDRP